MRLEFEHAEPPELAREIWTEGALTVTGAASLMATSRKTLFVLMKEGRLPWGRFGSHRRIPRRAVIDMLAGSSSSDAVDERETVAK